MKLKWSADGLKSPVARAKGLGTSHHGTEHWVAQRVTAFSNLIVVTWMLWSVWHLAGADYATFTTWLAQPVNAILCILFVSSTFYHAYLGLTVVIEDYISVNEGKPFYIWGLRLALTAMAVASYFSILKIAFTA